MVKSEADLRHELEERLRFETLLTDISARFINLPSQRIDDEIEEAQRRVCQCLGIDLSALWQWSQASPHYWTLTHLFSPPEGPDRPEGINAAEAFPWTLEELLKGKTLAFSTSQLPPDAVRDKESRDFFDVKSSVVIPLATGSGPMIGILTFDTLREERTWPEEIVQRLNLVAQIFSTALARRLADNKLRESKARLALAADSAGMGIWVLECCSNVFWATRRARRIFGYQANEPISMERFEASVHPDDRKLVRRVITLALEKGEPIYVEYRIQDDGGNLKWISSCGKPYFKDNGQPERLMGVSQDITDKKRMESDLKAQLQEIEKLKGQLEGENLYLRQDLKAEKGFEEIIGESKAIRSVAIAAQQVAATDATVLILGETGTGKGLTANAIHQLSDRRNQPLITVNCAALPPNLIESELFGREQGAFTGAHARQAGRFEVADGGTIFLDEIGEMPLELQTKLLRVLQEGAFERLGSAQTVRVNVRVIVATSRDLKQEVQQNRFRRDLYYRVNVFPITIPPLRQRTEDIPLLVQHFIEKYTRKSGKQINSVPKTTIKRLTEYNWPGNVRELEHMIERGVIVSSGQTLRLGDSLPLAPDPQLKDHTLKDLATVEREHILAVLRETGWRIEGASGAAAILKLHPSTLRFRMKKQGIQRPD